MAYNEKLANRIREYLQAFPEIEEKPMMGGLTFMYRGKMCVGVIKDEMMCRIDPDVYEEVLDRRGCREMDFTKRPMKGYVLIDDEGMRTAQDLSYWIELSIAYNPKAKSSGKKKNG